MKIMIVDDNKQLRESIKNSVDWESLGIHEIETAENGKEGLEIFRTFLPDIVLVDIMMPEMSGLDFLKLSRQIKPEAKVLIISGFSEFEYAVEALKYGASGYELKPLKMQQLMLNVSKLIKEIQQDSEKKEQQSQHMQAYREKLLTGILHGHNKDESVIEKLLSNQFGISLRNYILLLCVRVDKERETIKEEKLVLLEQMIKSAFKDQNEIGVLLREKDRYYIYQKCSASTLEQIAKQAGLAAVLRNLNELIADTGLTLSGGVSTPHRIYQISQCYEEASRTADTVYMAGPKKFKIFDAKTSKEIPSVMYQKQRELLDAWEDGKEGYESLIISKIEAIFQLFGKFDYFEETFCLRSTTLVMERIRQYFAADGCVLEEKDNQEFFRQIEKMESLDECEQLCKDYFFKLNQHHQNVNSSNFSSVVKMAREFVNKHYAEEITVGMVGEHIGKSPNYLSHIFKAECGISFSEFLNVTRIQKAKELILNSNLMIYEVAEAVGYNNYIHFTQVFKKYEGYSPVQLRKMKR